MVSYHWFDGTYLTFDLVGSCFFYGGKADAISICQQWLPQRVAWREQKGIEWVLTDNHFSLCFCTSLVQHLQFMIVRYDI